LNDVFVIPLSPTEIIVLSISTAWILLNFVFLREILNNEESVLLQLFSRDTISKSILVFLVRFFASFLILSHMENFSIHEFTIHEQTLFINDALILVALIWLPEILAVIQWGIIFCVFALAGLGAAIIIDRLYFYNYYVWGGFGPISTLILILIVLSFRYFSNYSINEIIKMAKNIKLLRYILLLASIAFILIGGGVLWRLLISSRFYKEKLSKLLDHIETATTAISVIVILFVLPLQFPQTPLWIQILIIINAPIAFAAVGILLVNNRFKAWKAVFEVYTEEFSAQSLIIKDMIANRKKFLMIALIGNWAAVPVALYNIGTVIFWIINDLLLTIVAVVILGYRYISSMIDATIEITKEIKTEKQNTEESRVPSKSNLEATNHDTQY